MKKRLVALTLVAAMALGMTACGSKSNNKTTTNDNSDTAVSTAVDWTSYDELVESIRTEADLAKRAEMMHQAEDMLMDTWCVIPLYYYNDQYMLKDYVTDVYSTVEGMKYFYNAKNTKNAGKLNIFMASEPDHIDPALNSTVDGGCLAVNSFEGLMRYNAEGKLEPACAESYEVSEDGLTYTFTMRDGLKWSNGDELTAKDFEWSWRRAADPKTAADYSYLCAVFAGYDDTKGLAADDVVASDDGKTLTVKLKAVTPYFLDLCAFPFFFPVNQKSVEGNDDWANDASDKFVTNGAFTLKEWKHDSSMTYVKNPNYWDAESVKTEKMNWPISESQSTRLTLVEGGEADMTVEPPVADQKRLEEAGLLHIGPMLGNYYYVFNVKADPFTNPDVRKAFSMVINRANIVNNIVRGGKEAAYAFVPYGMLESNGREDFREAGSYLVYEDVEQAKEILKKAGYDKNHPLPQITILYNTSELHKSIAEAIQDAWVNAFDADVRLQNQETKVFLADREAGKYQVARASWVADYSDPQNFLEVFSAEDNDGQYHSDEYNELIARIRITPNGAVRDALMHEAEKMIFDESLVMPLYFTTQPYVTNGTIQNYFWTTLGLVDFKKAYK